MQATAGHLAQVVSDSGDLPEYPLGPRDRLDSHFFITWNGNRWLNSTLRLKGTLEVRAVALDLFSICQNQTPVGTLPCDETLLAKLTLLPLETWRELCRREIGPLYNWYRVRCGGEVRLAHEVVTETVLEAVKRRKANTDRAARDAERKRLAHLRAKIVEAGGSSRLAENPAYVARLDAHLNETHEGNRTVAAVRAAMEALETAR